MSHYRSVTLRMYFVFLLFAGGFFFIGYHLYHVQIERHDELYQKAKEKYTAHAKTKGTRGEIFDWDGHLLVCNVPAKNIVCDPSIAGGEDVCREMASFFAEMTGENEETIFQRLMQKEYTTTDKDGNPVKRPVRYKVIASRIELDLSEKIREEVVKRKYRGIRFLDTTYRSYPKDEMLANVLGITSMSEDKVVPLAGLEMSLNKEIKSGEGRIEYERMRDGRSFSYAWKEREPEQDGCDIFLTIREPIQSIVEEELDNLMERIHPKSACAIMVDPDTGDILAMAQRPTYNPNDRSVLTRNPGAVRNRIVEDYFEPGSVMKPFTISYAIDQQVITPDTMIDCTDGVWIYAKRRLRDTHRIGNVPVTEMIKQSSNIGTAKVALMLGEKRLYTLLTLFGFGRKTGLPLRQETAGNLRPLARWDGLSITRFCIGQGIGVSALQLVRAYCILANGGYPVDLRLVDRLDRNGITEHYPHVRSSCIFRHADTARKVREILKTVTEPGGSGITAAVPGYHVAGKTGTAEKFENGAYQKKYTASFCGFVPKDHPRFVLLVSCDEPPPGGPQYGGPVAGPTFAAIAARTLKYLRVPPEMTIAEWDAERRELWKKDHAKRVAEDARVRARRAARDSVTAHR